LLARTLAHLEEEEGLCLTPFERNLEVWRQLWRVVERSDIVIQVVDSRDPLVYFSQDLVAYAHDVHPTKTCLVLLNKADLLPASCRAAWADYFDTQGVSYAFWSAAAATDIQQKARQEASLTGAAQELLQQQLLEAQRRSSAAAAVQIGGEAVAAAVADERTQVLGVDELLGWMEEHARASISSSPMDDPRR
jgi:large subunit GTPase 1